MIQKSTLKKIVTTILLLAVAVVILFIVFVMPKQITLARQLPQKLSIQSTKNHIHYTKLQNISPFIQEAAIASQDKRFYANWGIDIIGTVRAILMTIKTGHRQGASTIPEQLAKNAYFHDKDTVATDIETKILAPFITASYSKKYILEMYLNDIYYGKSSYGIYNASETYFHTPPNNVPLAQSTYLIGLINAPSYFADHNKEAVFEAKLVLGEMQRDKYISKTQEQIAIQQLSLF